MANTLCAGAAGDLGSAVRQREPSNGCVKGQTLRRWPLHGTEAAMGRGHGNAFQQLLQQTKQVMASLRRMERTKR